MITRQDVRHMLEGFAAFWFCYSLGAAGMLACSAPKILGGSTRENTMHQCESGLWCPNWTDCPPLANLTGPCETKIWEPEPYEAAKTPDGGPRAGDAGHR